MALLIGEFETLVDAKHRLAINASFREQIVPAEDGENWILVLGPDRHLWLYPDLAYRKVLAKLQPSPLPDRNTSKISLLFAMARYLKSDSQGRVVLPEKSMERAIIGEQVTLVGMYDHIEIWPTEDWDRNVQTQLEGYGDRLLDAGQRLRDAGENK
jgi:MraZ protein